MKVTREKQSNMCRSTTGPSRGVVHLVQELCQPVMAATFALALLAGCSRPFTSPLTWWNGATATTTQPVGTTAPVAGPIRRAGPFMVGTLAGQIDEFYRGTNPGPIGVTTFANLDDLYTTSSFGRMLSEQLMSELALQGYDVVELRHAEALQFLSHQGEFALSRDIGMVRRSRDLGGVVVGTYVVSPVKVYINARLVNPATSVVMSAASVEVPRNPEVAKLLRAGGLPPALERIPVRHLAQGTMPLYGFGGQQRQWLSEESASPSPSFLAPRPPPEE